MISELNRTTHRMFIKSIIEPFLLYDCDIKGLIDAISKNNILPTYEEFEENKIRFCSRPNFIYDGVTKIVESYEYKHGDVVDYSEFEFLYFMNVNRENFVIRGVKHEVHDEKLINLLKGFLPDNPDIIPKLCHSIVQGRPITHSYPIGDQRNVSLSNSLVIMSDMIESLIIECVDNIPLILDSIEYLVMHYDRLLSDQCSFEIKMKM